MLSKIADSLKTSWGGSQEGTTSLGGFQEGRPSFTFKVDKVQINKKAPTLVTSQAMLDELIGPKLKYEDSSHRINLKEVSYIKGKIPGFIQALHTAYQDHYPLKLSVSDFIILIGQGLGRHMDKHAEKLRKHFVEHESKKEIVVRRDEFVMGSQNDWSTVFGEFADNIKERVKTDFYDVIVDDTSVATKTSRIVSEIALMDCMKSYFDYVVMTLCGIPEITLEGSKEDWQRLLDKVHKLQELNKDDQLLLDFWLKHLVPIVERICESAITQKPDTEFWSGIYKYVNPGSGTPFVSGWCTVFFPYLAKGVNPFDKIAQLTTHQLPKQISQIDFIWDYFHKLFGMKFHGGFLGAKYNKEKGCIEAEHFWAVTYDESRKNVKREYQEEQD